MPSQFDSVIIADSPTGTQYAVLESQVVVDFGQGQGPKGGALSILGGGFVSVTGSGEARLDGGVEDQGGVFPPRLLLTSKGKPAVEIAAHPDPTTKPSSAAVSVDGTSGTLRMRDTGGNDHALLHGAEGNLWLGGKNADGDVVLYKQGQTDNRSTDKATLHLDGGSSILSLRDGSGHLHGVLDGVGGDLWLGGKKAGGAVVLYRNGTENDQKLGHESMHLSGDEGTLRIRDTHGNDHALLDGPNADLWLGGAKASGSVMLFKEGQGDNRKSSNATIFLDGAKGDIILRNGDCAEDFDVCEGVGVEPGTVMAIDEGGQLQPSRCAYDRKVAGVIAGAGSCRPGIVLGREPEEQGRMPIALVGKVYCKVDATAAPIAIGDLLTTSATPGHAMKAPDPLRAFGAVIGKALGALESGTGLVPILVALQ